MIQIKDFQNNMFGVNTYVAYGPESREAMVVDPGMISDAEERRIDDFITTNNLHVKYIINTHLHLDHAFGIARAERLWGVKAMAHPADAPLGLQLPQQAAMFGIPGRFETVTDTTPISENSVITLGSEEIRILHSPGHSPGGIGLYAPKSGWLISGDSLFAGGIGRTDLPGGNHHQLIDSLRRKFMTLPESTVVYPGHGPATTIGIELHTNPYL